eukprot:366050-Chlamydomonas_euryale.AAC.9
MLNPKRLPKSNSKPQAPATLTFKRLPRQPQSAYHTVPSTPAIPNPERLHPAMSSAGMRVTLLDAAPSPGGLSSAWTTPGGRTAEPGIKGFWCGPPCPPTACRTYSGMHKLGVLSVALAGLWCGLLQTKDGAPSAHACVFGGLGADLAAEGVLHATGGR